MMVPSMVPWSSAGTTSDSGMPTPVAPSFAIFCRSSSVPLMRSFLPEKSASVRIGFLGAVIRGAEPNVAMPTMRLGVARSSMAFSIAGSWMVAAALTSRKSNGGAEHAEARIDADEEIDRAGIALDVAELHAFDLARDRAELARRIDLHLDAAAGRLLDFFLVEFEELMLPLVHGGAAHFHDEIGGVRRRGWRKTASAKHVAAAVKSFGSLSPPRWLCAGLRLL